MPKIETIKASDAPPPPKKMSRPSQAILSALTSLKKGEVLRLQPDPGKSLRGLKTSVGRAAASNNLKIESWTGESEDYLLVRKAQ